MRSASKFRWTFFLALSFVFLNAVLVFGNDDLDDEDNPEVTTRVARISFITGGAQIKRAGSNDWEEVSLNLPVVEGDEITIEKGSMADIQFDSRNILHLMANSSLKIVTLRDEGIAVSLSAGTMSLRVFSFDKDNTFFEIDAPQTTISIQQAGLYRIDAGENDADAIRVTATEGGEARVFTDDSGFTLRDGKSIKIFITGGRTGDRETLAIAPDDWDKWVAERDAALAKLIDNAYYDKYYDRDIYGAEDLNSFGNWQNTDDYGWVWRPNQSAVGSYQDWTPYRYGHWSWISPYGWTWINDEPWGWATYHYGRWVYADNNWAWTPYPYNRPHRSWWRPAIVVIGNVSNDICWYPLPYRNRYHDYNRDDRKKYVDRRNIINSHRSIAVNQPEWTRRRDGKDFDRRDGRDNLPPNAVVAVNSDRFGRRGNYSHSLPEQTIGKILAKNADEIKGSPKLPKFKDRRQDFKRIERSDPNSTISTGAMTRQPGIDLDKQLENRRNQDRRSRDNSRQKDAVNSQNAVPNGQQNTPPTTDTPVQPNTPERNNRSRQRNGESETQPSNSAEKPNENRPRRNSSDEERNSPRRTSNNTGSDNSNDNNRNNNRRDNNNENRKTEQPRQTESPSSTSPPPARQERQERQERQQEQPKQERRSEEPRREQPKQERQEQPRQERQEQPRRESPPPRQEQPKQESKPAPTETKREDPKRDTAKDVKDN